MRNDSHSKVQSSNYLMTRPYGCHIGFVLHNCPAKIATIFTYYKLL